MIGVVITVWVAVSPVIGWLAGRFISVGMVELRPEECA